MTRANDLRVLWLPAAALVCWLLMFMAFHDVWHDVGKPDITARLAERGATLFDMRAFVYAFYGLFVVLTADLAVTAARVLRRR